MANWYYHDGAGGHVGPMDATQLREALRLGHVNRDTLVWAEGQAEWTPLAQHPDVLQTDGLEADPDQPPPLPQGGPAPVAPRHTPYAATVTAPAPSRMPTWAIVGLVLAVLALPALAIVGILAAIAVPAYQDYTHRAEVTTVMAPAAALKPLAADWYATHQRCPTNDDMADAVHAARAGTTALASLEIGPDGDGDCAINLGMTGIGADKQPGTLVYWFSSTAEEPQWYCYSRDIDDKYLPSECRSD